MQQAPLTILVIDENPDRAATIEAGLRGAGEYRVVVLDHLEGVARRIVDLEPDVIVIDLGNPNRDMLESVFALSRAVKRPVAMFVDRSDAASIREAVEAGVSAYVVDGLKRERVKPIIDMAISRFEAYARLEEDLREARDALAGRELLERAKKILMHTRAISEAQAHALLRKTAMNQNRRMVDVAEGVITAAKLLQGDDEDLK